LGALDRVRVVDFGHYVAGPMAGMLLADQGADVIKVDRPGEAPTTNPVWNRGKRSITIDLADADGLEVGRRLIERADIVIENFGPGTMDRLGLGDADTRADNPGLIHVSMPAFGPEDARAEGPGWEPAVLAALDVYRPAAPYRDLARQLDRRPEDRDGPLVVVDHPMASMHAALIAVTAAMAALGVRARTGLGQRIEVPLFDAMVQAIGVQAATELPFKPTFAATVTPWNHQYRCADDRWVHVSCGDPDQAAELARHLGRPDFVERGMTAAAIPDTASEVELILALENLFASKPADEWEQQLAEEDLPVALCRTEAEWLAHPHATQGALHIDSSGASDSDSDSDGNIQPAAVVDLGHRPTTTVPQPDQHRRQILAELEDGSAERGPLSSLNPGRPPLDGVRVIDIGGGVAAPLCGRVLAELGADVIAVDDPNRPRVRYVRDLTRGKRSFLLDIADERGRAIIADLIETADVLIESLPPGEAQHLGIDYETLKADNPELTYVSVSAYDEVGPWSDLIGTGETVQALTGMQVSVGGTEQPAVWPYPLVVDHATGYAAAYGTVAALLERRGTFRGRHVTTSLVRVASLLQFGSSHQVDAANRCEADTVTTASDVTWLHDAMSDPVVARRGLGIVQDDPTLGMLRTTGPGPWFSRSRVVAGATTTQPGAAAAAIMAELGRAEELDALIEAGVIADR
jgi:crotonobetainyl-CoA:carnitine CoA-transferase CaiB-like acyl-CoA transferase